MTPQVKTILKHLQDHGSISQAEASTVYRIRALPRRIADLKAAGYKVKSEIKKDATGQRYARYTLVAVEPKAEAEVQEAPVLRVGAKIRMTKVWITHGYRVGSEGIVHVVDDDGDIWVYFKSEDPVFVSSRHEAWEVIA